MAHLVVVTHKACWNSPQAPTGYATDGGFPFQMEALSELFDSTTLLLPLTLSTGRAGEMPLRGHNLKVKPLTPLAMSSWGRKLSYPFWLLRNLPRIFQEMSQADAVHALIPGDVGLGALTLAVCLRKPLLVRHCGNWLKPTTVADRFGCWLMERFAGGRNVMFATGGAKEAPSARNPSLRWIFSTTLREMELKENAVDSERPFPRRVRLIVASRQEKAKGTEAVLESLPLLLKRFPQVELDVVGDGGYLPALEARARALGLGSAVRFQGKVDHARVIALLKQADLFCFPTSSSEGFPKGVVEALSCGLPVITTRVSVLPQLIGTGCGILLDAPTPEAVATAVAELIGDPKRYQEMSKQAVITARSYSLESWCDRIGEELRQAWRRNLREEPVLAS